MIFFYGLKRWPWLGEERQRSYGPLQVGTPSTPRLLSFLFQVAKRASGHAALPSSPLNKDRRNVYIGTEQLCNMFDNGLMTHGSVLSAACPVTADLHRCGVRWCCTVPAPMRQLVTVRFYMILSYFIYILCEWLKRS